MVGVVGGGESDFFGGGTEGHVCAMTVEVVGGEIGGFVGGCALALGWGWEGSVVGFANAEEGDGELGVCLGRASVCVRYVVE